MAEPGKVAMVWNRVAMVAALWAMAGCAGGPDKGADVPAPMTAREAFMLDGAIRPDLIYPEPVPLSPAAFPQGRVPVKAIFDQAADLARCEPGRLKPAERQQVLDQLNHVRALHRLPPVRYEPADDRLTTAAALIMAANDTLTHTPTPAMLCWTVEGAEGADVSNLGKERDWTDMGDAVPNVRPSGVANWLVDQDVTILGHRRWLLMPALDSVSYGRTIGNPPGPPTNRQVSAEAIRVTGRRQDISRLGTEVIAYPIGDYPRQLFPSDDVALSVSILADRSPHGGNGRGVVDFDRALIRVMGPDGVALPVRDVGQDYEPFGLANVLYWKLSGVQPGVRYQVEIRDIRVHGVSRAVAYPFRLIATGAPVSGG
ncbi:hypothetical protein P7L64_22215 [Tistrella bauzanensis]|nr:hypothetical protein [Tistrella bauzanensis]